VVSSSVFVFDGARDFICDGHAHNFEAFLISHSKTWKKLSNSEVLPRLMAHPSSHSNALSANDRASYSSLSIGDRDDEELNNGATTTDQKEIGTMHKAKLQQLRMWNPTWLSTASLFGFVMMFIALAISLILLWRYSSDSDGFALITSNHYSWTYGPTAILVVVASLWRQVDFWCKALAPWDELHNGDATVAKSLLLDYISPIQLTSLTRAIRNRHVSVIATILGFTLLKLITIVSTGLLVMIPNNMPIENATFYATTFFNGSGYNETNSVGVDDPSLAYTAYAVMNQHLPYSEGMKSDLAYQSVVYPANSSSTNASIIAEVNAFFPHFDCELAKAYMTMPSANDTDEWTEAAINATSASCNLMAPYGYSSINIPCDPRTYACSPRVLTGGSTVAKCPNSASLYPDPHWELLTISDIRCNQTFAKHSTYDDGYLPNITKWSIDIQVSAILCQSSYTMEKALVTYDLTQSPPQVNVKGPLTRTNATLPGFSNADLVTEFEGALIGAVPAFGDGMGGTFFGLMSDLSGGGLAALLNGTAMGLAAEKAFQNIAVQIAKRDLLHPTMSSLEGRLAYSEQRLYIRGFSLWVMVAGFTTMAALSCVVMVARPKNVVPRDPEPIASTAMMLLRSHDLQNILQQNGQANVEKILKALSSYRFRTSAAPAADGRPIFRVETSTVDSKTFSRVLSSPEKTVRWWEPFPMRWPVFTVTMCLPLAMTAALEILQHKSNRPEGISNMTNNSSLLNGFYTRYLPALVMLGLATLYNSLDFTVSSFAPYQALKVGNVPASKSLMSSLLGKMPPHALWSSFRNRHWGALASAIPAFVGSFLTIIVSGLFTIQDISIARNVTVQRLDQFHTVWKNSVGNDNSAAALTTLTESLNLTYPKFTYEELAFPTIGLSASTKIETLDTGQVPLTLRIPALRASLDCTIVPYSDYNVSVFEAHISADSPNAVVPEVDFSATAPLPPNCLLGGQGGNLSYMAWGNTWMLDNGTRNARYVGKILDLHVGPWTAEFEDSSGETTTDIQGDNPPGCPSLAFIFGYVSVNGAAKSNVTTMMCYQLLEEVQTNATFYLPGFTISASNPPVPDESTVKYLHSSSNGDTAFEFRPQSHFDNEFAMFGEAGHGSGEVSDLSSSDPFFQAVLVGRNPVAPEDLVGPENQNKLLTAIQGFYRRYMAQAISANMRVKDTTPTPQTFTGTFMDPGNGRLKQNNAAKITLQVLLGIMFIFGALAYGLTNIRNSLPHDPCSIAGVASLLAGSEMCSESIGSLIPDGAEWMSDKELKQHNVWQGWLFSLGWWDWRWGEKRRYGIDIGRAEKE
jgi:hypothetical protein